MERAVWTLATRQWGVFTVDQLEAVGLSPSAVRSRAAAAKLQRLYRGVYSLVPGELLTAHGRWLAAVYAAGPGAVLSHASSAHLLGLRASDAPLVDVTIPTRAPRKQRGIRIHRSVTLTAADITVVGGIPCTSVSRTLLDLAGMFGRRALERALDQAETVNLFDLIALEDQLRRNRNRRGAKVLRAVLEEHHIGTTVSWSELEERFLALVRRHRLPYGGGGACRGGASAALSRASAAHAAVPAGR